MLIYIIILLQRGSALVLLPHVSADVDKSALIPGNYNNECLNRRLWGVYELVVRKEGWGDLYKFSRTRECLESMSTV